MVPKFWRVLRSRMESESLVAPAQYRRSPLSSRARVEGDCGTGIEPEYCQPSNLITAMELLPACAT